MATRQALALAMGAGGAPLADPHSLPGLQVWLDGGDRTTLWKDVGGAVPVTSDGDPVALWKDKSGNGFDFSNPTAGQRPLYKTGIFGSESALLGDGVQTYLHNSTYNATTSKGISLYIVTKAVSTATFQCLFSGFAGTGAATTVPDGFDFETWPLNRWLLDRFDTDTDGLLLAQTAAGSTFTQPQVIASVVDVSAGTGTMWVNGGGSGTDTMSDRTHLNPTSLRVFARVDAPANYYGGYIQQVLLYTGTHSTAQVNQVLSYLMSRCFVSVAQAL